MKNQLSKELLDNLNEDVLHVIQQVETHFKPLSEQVLHYKPAPDQWSIAECISHMNIADDHYYQQIEKKLQDHNTQSQESYSGGALGNYFTKMMKPKENNEIPNKMKTFKRFFPVISLNSNGENAALKIFLRDQQTLLQLIDKAQSANLEKIKIKSALGGWLMFKLGDAFRFVIAHNQRHVQQAMNVLKEYQKHASVNTPSS